MNKKDEIMEQAIKIVNAIRADQGGIGHDFIPKEFISKTIKCPICKTGDMTYTISEYNGHRSGKCECFGMYCE